jgi:hypothetical protein
MWARADGTSATFMLASAKSVFKARESMARFDPPVFLSIHFNVEVLSGRLRRVSST